MSNRTWQGAVGVLLVMSGAAAGYELREPAVSRSQDLADLAKQLQPIDMRLRAVSAGLDRLRALQVASLSSSDSSCEAMAEQLARQRLGGPPQDSEPEPSETSIEADEEKAEVKAKAFEEGHQIVASVISSRRYTKEDQEKLLTISALNGEEKASLLRELARQVNEGKLRLDF